MTQRSLNRGKDVWLQRSSQQTIDKALSFFRSGRFDKAEKLARSLLAAEPRNAELLQFIAVLCQSQGRNADAAALCAKAVAINPGSAEAHYNLGTAQMKLSHAEEAIANFQKSLAIAPQHYDALNNLSIALLATGKVSAAYATAQQAIAIAPRNPLAYHTLGLILLRQRRLQEAVETLKVALACGHPDPSQVWDRLGAAFLDLMENQAAVDSFRKALAHSPKSIEILVRLGYAQLVQIIADKEDTDAAQTFQTAARLAPRDPAPVVGHAFACLLLANWVEPVRFTRRIERMLAAPSNEIDPFLVLSLSDDPATHLRCSQRYAARFARPESRSRRAPTAADRSKDRIRIAYLSGDFRVHATTLLAAGLFEHHDRSRFETYAVAWDADRSAMRQRNEAAFDEFIDVSTMSDEAVVDLMLDRQIDIAIDLKGYTARSRPGILAHRPAPIQVSYLGYPGTMGAQWIDYLIADRFVAPPEAASFYSENLVYLPDCYQVNDDRRSTLGAPPRRDSLGLPDEGFVFGCFNAINKISPDIFAIWMRLLKAAPKSVLWLLDHGSATQVNLRREAEASGVAGERLVFAPRIPIAEHVSRLQCADLFLDTLPFNAHTTASDALWAGVPVVTCPGRSFQSRVAGSLLHAIGLPELVAPSIAEYEAIALTFAVDREAHAAIRAKLARNRLSAPLFDTAKFTRALEKAYETMWWRWCEGLEAASIDLSSAGHNRALAGSRDDQFPVRG